MITRLIAGGLAAALTAAPATTVVAPSPVGPPWISIEYPVNPHDQTTRDAFLLVHAFHHDQAMNFPVSGTAEGLVNGQRRTVQLDFQRTSRTGVYALKKQWQDEGAWTLLVAVAQGPEDKVWAVVDLGSNGEVAKVRVPTRKQGDWTVPAQVVMADVEASLRSRSE